MSWSSAVVTSGKSFVLKYLTALGLIAVMAATISLIDERSAGVTGPARMSDGAPWPAGRIYATGIVEGRTDCIRLCSEQVGRVTEVAVSAGQMVEVGDILVRLENARQQQEVALAEANLELAQAELERLENGARPEARQEAHALRHAAKTRLEDAARTWNRLDQLRSQQAVSQQDADNQQSKVETLRAELDAAEARVQQIEAPARADEMRSAAARVAAAKAGLDLAKIGLAKTELRAPCRGCVLDVNVELGELTGPDAIEPLVLLTDTSVMRVRAFVEELDAPRVKVGMIAQVTADGLPDTTFVGRIVSLSPCMTIKSIDSGRPQELYDTKVREVMIELEAANQLIVGLRVDVSFGVGPTEEASSHRTSSTTPLRNAVL